MKVPVVDIVEIGAGGGSIAWFDAGGALRVGPVSAGADPGPACYGRGGTEPTVTDALLITGILDPNYFLGGRLQVDVDLARAAYEPIARRLGVSIEEAAAGVIRVANEQTIDALKLISVRRGYDPRDFTLVAFGGGGPTHAAALLDELGVRRIVVPPFPGTFSAWGMLMTEPRVDRVQTRILPLDTTDLEELECLFAASEAEAVAALTAQGVRHGIDPGSPPQSRYAISRSGAHGRSRGRSEHRPRPSTIDRGVPRAPPAPVHLRARRHGGRDRQPPRYGDSINCSPHGGIADRHNGGGNPHKGTRLVHFGHGQRSPHAEPVSTPVYDRAESSDRV